MMPLASLRTKRCGALTAGAGHVCSELSTCASQPSAGGGSIADASLLRMYVAFRTLMCSPRTRANAEAHGFKVRKTTVLLDFTAEVRNRKSPRLKRVSSSGGRCNIVPHFLPH